MPDPPSSRPETGPMKFGSDWTGVFIRGDDAFGYAMMLERLLKLSEERPEYVDTQIMQLALRGLLKTLQASNEQFGTPANLQCMRDIAQCRE